MGAWKLNLSYRLMILCIMKTFLPIFTHVLHFLWENGECSRKRKMLLLLPLTISAATKIGFYTNFAAIVKTDGLSRVHFGGEIFILYAFQSIESEQQVYTI